MLPHTAVNNHTKSKCIQVLISIRADAHVYADA
jgi:hypothetical protein